MAALAREEILANITVESFKLELEAKISNLHSLIQLKHGAVIYFVETIKNFEYLDEPTT